MNCNVSFASKHGPSIPLRQIEENRRAFGAERIRHHVELRSADPWTGLAAFTDACRRGGLGLRSLRYGATGKTYCILAETEATDFLLFDRAFSAQTAISLVRWTIEIGLPNQTPVASV